MTRPRSRIYDYITREHTLSVSARRLTRIIERHGLQSQDRLSAALDSLAIRIVPAGLMITGRFQRDQWSGGFQIHLQPSQVIWNTDRHALFFKLLDHDIQFDRSLRGVLASIGLATVNGLFGKHFLLNKTITAIHGDQVAVELDRLHPKLQAALEAFTLHRITCAENALRLVLSTCPRKVLKSFGHLLTV